MIKFPIVDVINKYNVKEECFEQIFTIKMLQQSGSLVIKCIHGNSMVGSKTCNDCEYNSGFDYAKAEIKCNCSDWVNYIVSTDNISNLVE